MDIEYKKAYTTSPVPMEVGTTFVQKPVFLGQSFQIAAEGAKYDLPAAFGYIYAEGILVSVWNYQITPIDSGSQLLITIEFVEAGGLTGVLKCLLRPLSQQVINRNIDNFHAWVERWHAPNPYRTKVSAFLLKRLGLPKIQSQRWAA